MGIFKVYVILALFITTTLGGDDKAGCDEAKYLQAGTKIVNDDCPDLLAIADKDVNFFPDCLVRKHSESKFTAAMKTCAKDQNEGGISYNDGLRQSCRNHEVGDKAFCCILTQELKNTTVSLQSKYQHTQECINEWKQQQG